MRERAKQEAGTRKAEEKKDKHVFNVKLEKLQLQITCGFTKSSNGRFAVFFFLGTLVINESLTKS